MNRSSLKDLTSTALMTALLCVLGPLMIPIGPIPFSLQVLVVFLCVFVLGMKRGTMAVVVYLLIGFAGVPVFSGFAGGPAKVLGPTGGFLIGFVPLALISGFFVDRFPNSAVAQFAGMFAGLAVLYVFGTAWLVVSVHLPLEKALHAAVYPFVAIDTVKIVIAILLGRVLRGRLNRA